MNKNDGGKKTLLPHHPHNAFELDITNILSTLKYSTILNYTIMTDITLSLKDRWLVSNWMLIKNYFLIISNNQQFHSALNTRALEIFSK